MKTMRTIQSLFLLILFLTMINCERIHDFLLQPEEEYQQLLARGWDNYEKGRFVHAFQLFWEARQYQPEEAAAYIGLGWTLMKVDSLRFSLEMFDSAAVRLNRNANLFAGWAFALNAVENFEGSNMKIDSVLVRDSTWVFPYDASLSVNDLVLLRAENYFLLGDFQNSLLQVQRLNPLFRADVSTPEGQAALSQEIERLKQLV